MPPYLNCNGNPSCIRVFENIFMQQALNLALHGAIASFLVLLHHEHFAPRAHFFHQSPAMELLLAIGHQLMAATVEGWPAIVSWVAMFCSSSYCVMHAELQFALSEGLSVSLFFIVRSQGLAFAVLWSQQQHLDQQHLHSNRQRPLPSHATKA